MSTKPAGITLTHRQAMSLLAPLTTQTAIAYLKGHVAVAQDLFDLANELRTYLEMPLWAGPVDTLDWAELLASEIAGGPIRAAQAKGWV